MAHGARFTLLIRYSVASNCLNFPYFNLSVFMGYFGSTVYT